MSYAKFESQPRSVVIGEAWERYWFTPADPLPLAWLRIALGVVALYYAASFTPDLSRWFASDGILPPSQIGAVIQQGRLVTPADPPRPAFHPSLLNMAGDPTTLWLIHGGMLLAIALFTAGAFTRVTSVLALVSVLSYYHRAPMLAGQLEAPLAIMLFYLCLGPCGAYLSVDNWLRPKSAPPSIAANISLKLIQWHTAALYFVMGVLQLGSPAWWSGLGVWWLAARTESRLFDLTGLAGYEYLVNLWSYAIVGIELAFATLIWKPWARKMLLVASVFMWLSLIPVSGLVGWCLFMPLLGLAFVPGETLRRITRVKA